MHFFFILVDLNGYTEDIYNIAPQDVCAALCGMFL